MERHKRQHLDIIHPSCLVLSDSQYQEIQDKRKRHTANILHPMPHTYSVTTDIHQSPHHHNAEMTYKMKTRMKRRTFRHRHPEEISHRASYRQTEERQHVFIAPPESAFSRQNLYQQIEQSIVHHDSLQEPIITPQYHFIESQRSIPYQVSNNHPDKHRRSQSSDFSLKPVNKVQPLTLLKSHHQQKPRHKKEESISLHFKSSKGSVHTLI